MLRMCYDVGVLRVVCRSLVGLMFCGGLTTEGTERGESLGVLRRSYELWRGVSPKPGSGLGL